MEAFMPFVIVAGITVFFFFVVYICCIKTKTQQLHQQHLQQQQQHQQQWPVENSAIFSIYPIKPELDPPPSYESVISQK